MKRALIAAAAALAVTSSFATEGGGSIYPVGTENYVCCALPPPGVYGMVFAQRYSADSVRGNNGQVVTPPTFKVTSYWPTRVRATTSSWGSIRVAGPTRRCCRGC